MLFPWPFFPLRRFIQGFNETGRAMWNLLFYFGGHLVTLLEELVGHGHGHVDILLASYNSCLAGSRLCNERILAVLLLFVYGRHFYFLMLSLLRRLGTQGLRGEANCQA